MSRRDSTARKATTGSQKRGSPSAGDIYREAARRIAAREPTKVFRSCCGETGGCLRSCCMVLSLSEVYDGDHDNIWKDRYADLFAPMEHPSPVSYWGDQWGRKARDCRILALCFMAAIADSVK